MGRDRPAAIAALCTILFLFSRAANPRLVPFFILVFAIPLGAAAAIGWLLGRWVPRPLATAACFVALFLAGRHLPVPVPAVPRDGNAASSLHATAGDLARFLIAAADTAAGLRAARVKASEPLAWGLGIGIQPGASGDALFHWGLNPSVRAARVIYPDAGAAEVALRAIGGEGYWAEE